MKFKVGDIIYSDDCTITRGEIVGTDNTINYEIRIMETYEPLSTSDSFYINKKVTLYIAHIDNAYILDKAHIFNESMKEIINEK